MKIKLGNERGGEIRLLLTEVENAVDLPKLSLAITKSTKVPDYSKKSLESVHYNFVQKYRWNTKKNMAYNSYRMYVNTTQFYVVF